MDLEKPKLAIGIPEISYDFVAKVVPAVAAAALALYCYGSKSLLAEAKVVAEESGVGALVYEEAIPVSDAAAELAKRTGTSPLEHALSDGEDYELLFTVAPEEVVKLTEGEPLGVRVTRIGEVIASGLRLRRRGGEVIGLEPEGYEHRVG